MAALDWYTTRWADVIVVSFPKAGRTWLRMLVGRSIADHFGLEDASLDDVLDVTALSKLDRRVPHVLFTHDGNPEDCTPAEIAEWSRKAYRRTKVVLLVRDPRDVIVSLYYQQAKRSVLQDVAPIESSLSEFIHQERGGFDSIIAFYRLWATSREVPKELCVVRYEDLHSDPALQLRRVLTFAGMPEVSDTTVADAVAAGGFENMRRIEHSGAISSEALKAVDVGDTSTYKTREGKVGGFVNAVSAEDAAWMSERMADLPEQFGY